MKIQTDKDIERVIFAPLAVKCDQVYDNSARLSLTPENPRD